MITVQSRYRDPSHPIHAALPLADALDQIDRSDDRDAYEMVLNLISELAGGQSEEGFRVDLLDHVRQIEQDDAESRVQDWRDRHDYSRRPDEGPPAFDGYEAGEDAAGLWLVQARDVLRDHGLAFDGRRIVSAMRRAA